MQLRFKPVTLAQHFHGNRGVPAFVRLPQSPRPLKGKTIHDQAEDNQNAKLAVHHTIRPCLIMPYSVSRQALFGCQRFRSRQ